MQPLGRARNAPPGLRYPLWRAFERRGLGVWRSTSITGRSTARSGVDTGVASQDMGLGLVMGLGALPRVRARISAKTRIEPAAIPGQTGWVFAGFLIGYLKREEAWMRVLDWPLAHS